MALFATVGGSGALFIGEDKQIALELIDTNANPVNMLGWTIQFVVRTSDTAPDPPVLTLPATISGAFNAVRSLNLQRAVVQLTEVEMELLSARTYRQSFKRTDSGSQTIFEYGPLIVEAATNQ